MKVLTEKAVVKCLHSGVVEIPPSQAWVRVDRDRILVSDDPEGRDIDRCPNRSPTIKKCGKTLKVRHGYSVFVRIGGRPVCLDSLWGLTDGTPPGVVKYNVRAPGQDWLEGTA